MNVKVFQTKMAQISEEMTFRVMTPDGYETSERRYPVFYMNDGQDVFFDEDAINGKSMRFAKYYSDFSAYLPQVIIVGIDCPMNNAKRTRLYTPYNKHFQVQKGVNFESDIQGQGDAYLEWLTGELKPWIDENYRTKSQPEYTGLGGYSTGGVLSAYGVLTHAESFSRMLALSGAFYNWMDCLDSTLDAVNVDHVKYVYMDVSTKEQGRYTTPEQFVTGAKMMNDRFINLGLDEKHLKFEVFEGLEHSQSAYKQRFPDGLRWIFRDLGTCK